MAFRIDPDRSVKRNVRRLGRRELDRSLRALADPERVGLEETVHEVRTRCKRVRAVLRLARPGLRGEYAIADAAVRDAARELGGLRDARAMLRTFDALVAATHGERADLHRLASVRATLEEQASEAEDVAAGPALARAAERLAVVRGRLGRWRPQDDPDVLVAGLVANRRRGRRAFAACCRGDGPADAWHEWRRRTKYEWHHVHLLRPLAPSALRPQEDVLRRLSGALGDDHDLVVLRAALPALPVSPAAAGEAYLIIDAVQEDLRDRCLRLGGRLHAETPGALGRRVAGYWSAWGALGRERPVGPIEDLASEPADRPPRRRPGHRGVTALSPLLPSPPA